MSILRTYPAFTRTGAQCGVCSSWKKPCERCQADGRVVTEVEVKRLLLGIRTASRLSRS